MSERSRIKRRENASMIEIKPNGLYTRSDLACMLEPCGVDVDHFIGRLRPRKVFKMLWTGEDILEALRTAPPLAQRTDAPQPPVAAPPPANKGNRTRRNKAPAAGRPGSKLAAYMESLKEGQS